MRLKEKVAIITGGANGIGLAATKRFTEEGAKVAIADFDATQGEKVAAELKANGADVIFVQVDVTNRDSVVALVEKTKEAFGQINILINNAGITKDAMLHKLTEEAFDAVMSVNTKGVFNCTQLVVPSLIEAGGGKIINTTSVAGIYGNIGQTNYAASKAAVVGLTKTWAKELGPKGINVNAVAPGFAKTQMTETIPNELKERMLQTVALRRLGEAVDIANAYVFLASDESSYITGHTLQVDGGLK